MNHRGLLLCLALILICCHFVSAQYRFDSWTTDNGLPQNGVRAITQTPDGYLWLTTLDGLVRFDGLKFTVFDKSNSKGIISNRFWGAKAFEDGSIWAATEGGDITVYRNGEFTSYPAEKIPEESIIGFENDENGEVMITTNLNYYYLRNGEFVFAKPTGNDKTQKHFYLGQSGTRWEIYTTEIRQIKAGQTKIYPINLKYVFFYFYNAFEDKKGGLWIADLGKLFYLHNGEITEYTQQAGFLNNVLGHSFWEDDDGSVWFATGDYNVPGIGLVRFKDGKFSKFGVENGLSNDRIFRRFKDREGTVWLATDRGLNRLRKQVVTPLSTKDGLIHNEVYPMLKSRDGSIYIGTNGGLSRYQDGRFTNTALSFGKSFGVSKVQSLAEDTEGRLWVGAISGLFVIQNGKIENWAAKFENQVTIYAIYPNKDGTVLLGTEYHGVWQYKDGKITQILTTEQGLAGNDVKFFHTAKNGSIWIGTFGGISVADCGTQLTDCQLKNHTTDNGLPSNFVRSIYEDSDGTIWIGTFDNGLSRYKDGKFFNFNKANGLFSNGVFAIVEDKNGNFWMSSNQGIYRASKQQLNDFADGKMPSYESIGYGKNDGMLNNECNGGRQPSVTTDEKGQIWFPTLEGIAIVDPNSLSKNILPPPVEIESIEIDRKKVWQQQTSIQTQQNEIQINPSDIHLDISYTAPSFIKSDQIHFRYKLEGLDENWIEAGTRRTISYTHLPAGNYILRVIAANSDGVWNMEGKSVKIRVKAPFYLTFWFWILIILTSSLLVYLIYRYRISQLQKLNVAQKAFSRQLIESQEAERKRIAQELHDGLGQNLLVIKNRALLGLTAQENREKADEQFNEIQESVTDALSEVRTIAYNLRPLHIERLGLTSTIEEMVEDVEKASGIQINCDIEIIDDLFSKENEINFYRIIQECLNNIVKHSRATKASVSVFQENSKLLLNIRDNGSGFDVVKTEEKNGLGLNGIAERAKILRGLYSINSEIGKGTTVSIEIPKENINETI